MNRVTHAYDGPLALFIIGLRVHKPWKLRVVKAAGAAMPKMIGELEENKAAAERGEVEHLGYLGSRQMIGADGVTLIQYWRSVEEIYAYANDGAFLHRPAWVDFYRATRDEPDAVTVWHETYQLVPHGAESAYAGPKPLGLAAIDGVVPIARRGESARERMGGVRS